MTRLNKPSEVFARVTEAGVIRDETGSPASTTLDAAASEDDTTINIPDGDESNFAQGDVIRIDTGLDLEMQEVESTAVGELTLRAAVAFDHDSGVEVVLQTKDVLGDVTDDGITEDVTADMTDIDVATQFRRYTRLVTQADGRIEFSLENVNTENMLFSMGMDETSEVTGSGTADDPYVAVHDPLKIADKQLNDIAIYMEGVLDDGVNVEVHGWNAEIDPNRSRTWNTGTGTPVPIAADVSTLVMRTWS